MASKVFNIIIKLSKEGGADKDTIKGLVDIKNTMVAATAVVGGFTAAYYTADKVLQATVGKFVTLTGTVEKFKNLTGMSAEDSSRMIEVMADLEISAEAVGTAFKFAEKNGFSPNIQSVLALREQYLALNPGLERTQFLLDKFGKSGVNLQKFFETGDTAERLREVQDSVIISDEAIESVQEYKDNLDSLKDAWDGIKLSVGKGLLPEIIRILTDVNKVYESFGIMGEGFKDIFSGDIAEGWKKFQQGANGANLTLAALKRQAEETLRESKATPAFIRYLENSKIAAEALLLTEEELEQQAKDLAAAQEDLRKALVSQTDWELSYTGAKDAAEMAKLSFDMLGDRIEGLGPEGAQVWNGFLAATGQISPAALEQFVKIETAFQKIRDMVSQHIPVTIIVKTILGMQAGGLLGPPKPEKGGGGTLKLAPWASEADKDYARQHPEIYDQTGLAMGGPLGDVNIVGEQGEEWIIKNNNGGMVVLPNDMVRRMRSWGINPGGRNFKLGGEVEEVYIPGGGGGGSGGGTGGRKEWSPKESPGAGGGGGGSPAEQAVEAVTPVVAGVVQNYHRSSEQAAQESRRQTAAVEQAGANQARLLKSILNAIEGQPEQLAAEIQKRR
jgi:hypothetical protein